MPEWTHNALDAWADRDDPYGAWAVGEFRALVRRDDTPLALAALWPPPPTWHGSPVSGDRLPEWRVAHWGVKWDCTEVSCEVRGHDVRYACNTPHTAPLGWLKRASALCPRVLLRLSFASPDRARAGYTTFLAGQMIDTQVFWEPDTWLADSYACLDAIGTAWLLGEIPDPLPAPIAPAPREYPACAFERPVAPPAP